MHYTIPLRVTGKTGEKVNKGKLMFNKSKKLIKPNELNKYMEKKESSPKQQWLIDNTPAKIQTCISDLKYWGLI